MSCQRWVLVPRSVNLPAKRDNAGHEKTTADKPAIIDMLMTLILVLNV